MSQSITIGANRFSALVGPVLPSAGNDAGLPVLSGVLIETSGKWLTATATNRFQIAIKRMAALDAEPWPPFRVLVSTRSIKRILTTFKPARGLDPELTFTAEDNRLAVEVGGGLIGDIADAHTTYYLLDGEFPKIDGLFRKALAAEPGPTRHAFNWRFLSAFAAAEIGGSGLRVRTTGPHHSDPLLVTGEDFIGLIMPKRVSEDSAGDDWSDLFSVTKEGAAA